MKYNVKMKREINIILKFDECLKIHKDFKDALEQINRKYPYEAIYNCTMDYLPRIGEKVSIPSLHLSIEPCAIIKDIIHCMEGTNSFTSGSPLYEAKSVELILSCNNIYIDGLQYLMVYTKLFYREKGFFLCPSSLDEWLKDINDMYTNAANKSFDGTSRRWCNDFSYFNSLHY